MSPDAPPSSTVGAGAVVALLGGPVVDIPRDVDVVEGSDGPDFALPESDVVVDPSEGDPHATAYA